MGRNGGGCDTQNGVRAVTPGEPLGGQNLCYLGEALILNLKNSNDLVRTEVQLEFKLLEHWLIINVFPLVRDSPLRFSVLVTFMWP